MSLAGCMGLSAPGDSSLWETVLMTSGVRGSVRASKRSARGQNQRRDHPQIWGLGRMPGVGGEEMKLKEGETEFVKTKNNQA